MGSAGEGRSSSPSYCSDEADTGCDVDSDTGAARFELR